MSSALKIQESTENGLRTFFEFLLSNNKVKGIFTLRKMNEEGTVSYSLIADVDDIHNAVPLYPQMPVNAGKVLSDFTLQGPTQEPVAAFLRPCELRAFYELIKRNQGRMSHMAVSCVSCGMCSEVCPVDIPVSVFFSTVGSSLEKAFDYVPGRDVEEAVPSGAYKEQEFVEIGES